MNIVIVGEKQFDKIMMKLEPYVRRDYIRIKCAFVKNRYRKSVRGVALYEMHSFYDHIESDDYFIVSDDVRRDSLKIDDEHFIPAQVLTEYVGLDLVEYVKLKKNPVSIVSDTCWGGMVYHALGLRFDSPLINTSVEKEDYLKLIGDIPYYMSCEMEKYSERNAYTPSIGILGNEVKIMFNHYLDFEEGKNAWNKRIKRINYDNIFVQMDKYMTNDDVSLFDRCPYRKKFFSRIPSNHKDAIYLKQYEDVNIRIQSGEFTGYVQNIIQRRPSFPRPVDVIKMLNGSNEFVRVR